MSQINVIFQILVSIVSVSMIVLGVGALIIKQLRQPIERVRCIQWTLVALVVALCLRQAAVLPALSLAVLPPPTNVSPAPNVEQRNLVVATTALVSPRISQSQLAAADDYSATAMVIADADVAQKAWLAGISPWQVFQLTCVTLAVCGAFVCVAQLMIGYWQLRKLISGCEPASPALLGKWRYFSEASRLGTRVLISSQASIPLTFGIRRPVIVLPQSLVGVAHSQSGESPTLDYCLSHEFGHIRSGDNLTWSVVQWLQPILWFQPLFWFLRRELRTAQDQLADSFAVGGDLDRTEYAVLLVGMARQHLGLGRGLALTMADRRSSLYRRIELLLSERFHLAQVARRRVLLGTVVCFTMVAASLGALRLERASAGLNDDSKLAAQKDDKKDQVSVAAKPSEDAVELFYSGTVLDSETKQPIADATVVVRRSISTSYERKVMEESVHKTDKQGRYEFKIPAEQTAERGLYIELDVEHPDYAWKKGFGYSLGMIRKNELLGEKPFFEKVELNPAEVLTGRIVSPRGEPISNVNIQSYSKTSAENWQDYGSFFQTKSDKEGRFRLQLVKGGPSVFWVVPQDFAPLQIVSGTKRGDWGDIAVKEGISITGKVISATGTPVVDVWVNLEDEEVRQEVQLPVSTYVNRSAKTGPDGTFTLRPMKAGKYRINVEEHGSELTGERPRWSNSAKLEDVFVAQKIEIGPQDVGRPFTVQAKPHVEFKAQYLNSKGEPTTGHDVSIFGQYDGQWFHASFDPGKDGKIVGKLPHGLTEARLNAITNEHSAIQVRLEKDGPLHAGRDLKLGTIEDDITGIEIIRYKAPIVQLKPVDENGTIVKECKVSGIYVDGKDETMLPVGGMMTNIFFEHQEDGRQRTSQMMPARKIKFTINADGYTEASQEIELPEGAEQEIVLVLKKDAGATKKNDKVQDK